MIHSFTAVVPHLWLPASIMFLLTIGFTTLFFIPAIKFRKKNHVVNFYWAGFWVFLGMIASLAGAANILLILDLDTALFSEAALAGLSASFVFFVVFAWFRLSGAIFLSGLKRIFNKHSNRQIAKSNS